MTLLIKVDVEWHGKASFAGNSFHSVVRAVSRGFQWLNTLT